MASLKRSQSLQGKRDEKNSGRHSNDYTVYVLSKKEKAICFLACFLVSAFVSFVFYHSLVPVVIFAFSYIPGKKFYARHLQEKRKEKLEKEFKDGISAYASAIRAGFSAENAIEEARSEVARTYGEESILTKEFSIIKRKISVGNSIEDSMSDLARRTGIKEIRDMAEIFKVAKRSGGRLPEILTDAVRMINERHRLKEEIKTIMTAKKLEHRIMCLMPAAILLYVNATSMEFVSALYEGVVGRIIMTVAIGVYVMAIMLGEKIMKAEMR